VRHLVLPGGIGGTDKVLAFLANEVSRQTYLNLMDHKTAASGRPL